MASGVECLDGELTAGSVFLDVSDDALGELNVAPLARSVHSTPQRVAPSRVRGSPPLDDAYSAYASTTPATAAAARTSSELLAPAFNSTSASFEQTTDALDTSLIAPHGMEVGDADEFEALERLVAAQAAVPPPPPVTVSSILSAHRTTSHAPSSPRVVQPQPAAPVSAPAPRPAPPVEFDDDGMDLNSVVVGFRRALRDKTEQTGAMMPPPQATVVRLQPEPLSHADAAARIRARLHETVAMSSSYAAAVHELNASRTSATEAGYGDESDEDAVPQRALPVQQPREHHALPQRVQHSPVAPVVREARSGVTEPSRPAVAASPAPAPAPAVDAPLRRSTAGVAWTFGVAADVDAAAASIQTRFHSRMSPPAAARPDPVHPDTSVRRAAPPVIPEPELSSVATTAPVRVAAPVAAPSPPAASRIPIAASGGHPGVAHSPPASAAKRPPRSAAAASLLALAPHAPSPALNDEEDAPAVTVSAPPTVITAAPTVTVTAPARAAAPAADAIAAPSSDIASAIEAKVAALNSQIGRYQEEVLRLQAAQAALVAEKEELQAANAALVKERTDFKAWKAAETARLEEWKAEVTAKMERERRVAVRQAKAAANAGSNLDRQDKAELDDLRTTVAKLRSEVHAADARYKASVERHRTASAVAAERIAALEAQVHQYEEERIGKTFPGSSTHVPAAASSSGGQHRSSSLGASRGGDRATGGGSRRGSMTGAAGKTTGGTDAAAVSRTPAAARNGQRTAASAVRVVTRASAGTVPDGGDGSAYSLQHAARRRLERHAADTHDSSAGEPEYDPDRYTGAVAEAAEASFTAADSAVVVPPSSSKAPLRPPPSSAGVAFNEPPNLRAAAAHVEAAAVDTGRSGSSDAGSAAVPPQRAAASRFRVPAAASRQLQSHIQLALHAHNVGEGRSLTLAPQQERELGSGKRELVYPDGTRIVQFRNGTEKEHHEDGTVIIRFNNGDVKRTVPLPPAHAEAFAAPSGACVELYFYADSQTLQATYPSDVEVFEFSNGQLELHRRARGDKEVVFSDGELQLFQIDSSSDGALPTSTLRR